jgi:hypothetical protein
MVEGLHHGGYNSATVLAIHSRGQDAFSLDELNFSPISSFAAANGRQLPFPSATMTGWKKKEQQQAPAREEYQLMLIEEGPAQSASVASPP